MSVVTEAQRRYWTDNGFLVIPGFFSEDEIQAVERSLDRTWSERPANIVVDDLVTGQRLRASDLSDEQVKHPFKVNDLYLNFDEVRRVTLSERVGRILGELLGDEPVLCNTLNLEYGSQQADHVDTLYMTPATPDGLVATWMALEDTRVDAGPLRYFPESHRIAQYRFSNGAFHTVPEEMDAWADYMAGEVDKHGLEETRFLASRGDLFVWHAWLLHGGSEICTPGLTRSSLVSHFWTATDCEKAGVDLQPAPGGRWLRRAPQSVPESRAGADDHIDELDSASPTAQKRSLWERLRQLSSRGH